MIQRVYEQASKAFDDVVVATDDDKIFSNVQSFGGKAVMTSENHQSGTDRCAEAAVVYNQCKEQEFDVVINIQGDEPFIKPQQLKQLAELFEDKTVQIATLVKKLKRKKNFLTKMP